MWGRMHLPHHHLHHNGDLYFFTATIDGLMITMAINGATYLVSDQLAQKFERSWGNKVEQDAEVQSIDWIRTLRFGAVGMFWGGTTTFARFSFISLVYPGYGLSVAIGKVCINQLIFSPIAHGGILLINEWGKTGSFMSGWDKLRYNLLEVQLVTWATKIPLNLICFSLIDSIPLQALFMRTYDIVFYIFISHVADRDDASSDPNGKLLNDDSDDEDGSIGHESPAFEKEGWSCVPPIKKKRTCECTVM